MQRHMFVHLRPFLDKTLNLHVSDIQITEHWHHLSSFPSDTAMLYFSIVAIIFLESRVAGVIAFVWAFFTVGVFRVALGWHYPSDIAGALVLGPGSIFLCYGICHFIPRIPQVLLRVDLRARWVNALFFVFLADAYNLFPGLRASSGFVDVITKAFQSFVVG
jgi:undecaprenyl-diphosphatase